jgi:hypothetical protein
MGPITILTFESHVGRNSPFSPPQMQRTPDNTKQLGFSGDAFNTRFKYSQTLVTNGVAGNFCTLSRFLQVGFEIIFRSTTRLFSHLNSMR